MAGTGALTAKVQAEVRRIASTSQHREELTVNKVRVLVEEALGLDNGFLKLADWKAKSKTMIEGAFNEPDEEQSSQTLSPVKPKKRTSDASESPPAKKVKTQSSVQKSNTSERLESKSKPNATPVASRKLSKDVKQAQSHSRVKRKKSGSDSEESEDFGNSVSDASEGFEDSDDSAHIIHSDSEEEDEASGTSSEEDERPRPKNKGAKNARKDINAKPSAGYNKQTKVHQNADSDTSDLDESPQPTTKPVTKSKPATRSKPVKNSETATKSNAAAKVQQTEATESDDESDMSVLIDEAPKRKQKTSQPAKPNKKASTKSASANQGKELTPDEETIKTLQAQLIKCGIRKLWHRELAPYDSPKEKIKHLKKMLEDAGMTGRFSAEKAKQIKEARELAAELESAQAFEKSWGTEEVTGRARRSANYTIIDSDYEEAPSKPVRAGVATGLVDFGDSGDEGSD